MTQQQHGKTASQATRTARAQQDANATLEAQERYWREHFKDEPYYTDGQRFDTYEAAYRTGFEGRTRHAGKAFSDAESDLRKQYEATGAGDSLDWSDARRAVRAAWDRAEPGTSGAQTPTDVQQRPRH